jgi:hypothetical protein
MDNISPAAIVGIEKTPISRRLIFFFLLLLAACCVSLGLYIFWDNDEHLDIRVDGADSGRVFRQLVVSVDLVSKEGKPVDIALWYPRPVVTEIHTNIPNLDKTKFTDSSEDSRCRPSPYTEPWATPVPDQCVDSWPHPLIYSNYMDLSKVELDKKYFIDIGVRHKLKTVRGHVEFYGRDVMSPEDVVKPVTSGEVRSVGPNLYRFFATTTGEPYTLSSWVYCGENANKITVALALNEWGKEYDKRSPSMPCGAGYPVERDLGYQFRSSSNIPLTVNVIFRSFGLTAREADPVIRSFTIEPEIANKEQ